MSKNANTDLPDDVLESIHAGRKIEAIKRLRDRRNLDLKDAKEAVEAHMAGHPELQAPRGSSGDRGPGRFVALLIVVAVIYLAYRLLLAG